MLKFQVEADNLQLSEGGVQFQGNAKDIEIFDNNEIDLKQEDLEFHVSKEFDLKPEELKLLFTLPDADFIQSIRTHLPEKMAGKFIGCFDAIYSYVTARNYVENSSTFYLHIAATAAYEIHTGQKIKDRNHIQKAAIIVKQINNALDEFMENALKTDAEIAVFDQAQILLIQHAKIIEKVLNAATDQIKAELRETCGYNGNLFLQDRLTTPEKKTIRSKLHSAKTPKKTPRKLSDSDKLSIGEIQKGKVFKSRKALDFSDLIPQDITLPKDAPEAPSEDDMIEQELCDDLLAFSLGESYHPMFSSTSKICPLKPPVDMQREALEVDIIFSEKPRKGFK